MVHSLTVIVSVIICFAQILLIPIGVVSLWSVFGRPRSAKIAAFVAALLYPLTFLIGFMSMGGFARFFDSNPVPYLVTVILLSATVLLGYRCALRVSSRILEMKKLGSRP